MHESLLSLKAAQMPYESEGGTTMPQETTVLNFEDTEKYDILEVSHITQED